MLLIREEIPKTAKIERDHSFVARGETGNEHKMKRVNVYSTGATTLVEVTVPSELKHPQHPTVTVPIGTYRVARVRDRDVADALFIPVQSPITSRTTPVD